MTLSWGEKNPSLLQNIRNGSSLTNVHAVTWCAAQSEVMGNSVTLIWHQVGKAEAVSQQMKLMAPSISSSATWRRHFLFLVSARDRKDDSVVWSPSCAPRGPQGHFPEPWDKTHNHRPNYNSSSRGSDTIFWPPQARLLASTSTQTQK